VRKAIEAKLGADPQRAPNPQPVIERGARGVVVPARYLLRLGDGEFGCGKRFMHGVIKQIPSRRVRLLTKS
jgi:hypothetical protein